MKRIKGFRTLWGGRNGRDDSLDTTLKGGEIWRVSVLVLGCSRDWLSGIMDDEWDCGGWLPFSYFVGRYYNFEIFERFNQQNQAESV